MIFNKRNLTKNTFTNTFFKNTFSVQAQTRLLSHQEALIKEQIGLLIAEILLLMRLRMTQNIKSLISLPWLIWMV